MLHTIAMLAAIAAYDGNRNLTNDLGFVINKQGLGADRSFTLDADQLQGYGLLIAYVSIADGNNSVTALNMVCTAGPNAYDYEYALQDCTLAGGTATCYNVTFTKDPSAIASPKRWAWRVDVEGFRNVQCTFSNTGGAAADILSVAAQLAVK